MSESNDPLPLATLILFAYNQEQFIREAVAGALAQTYSPLEIIISDDASTDNTFCIMQEMAAAYKGPHRIILNRTDRNQGCAHHVNSVVPLASGSWIVTAAGDDISFPERVNRLMQVAREDSSVTALCSAWRNIDEGGRECEPDADYQGRNGMARIREFRLNAPRFSFHGAASAWKRELYTAFPPLLPDVMHEDLVLTFRALLCGDIIALPDILVSYRRWGGNVSAGSNNQGENYFEKVVLREKRSGRWHKSLAAAYRQMQVDLDTTCDAKKQMGSGEIQWIRGEIENRIRKYELIGSWGQYPSGKRFVEMLKNTQNLKWTVPRIFGIDFFASVYAKIKSVLGE